MSDEPAFPAYRAKPKPVRVLIVATHMTPTRGQLYSAYLIPTDYTGKPDQWTPGPSDLPIASRSRDPEFAACRWLQLSEQYAGGPAETWHPGDVHPALTMPSASVGAELTVEESERTGPILRRYREFSTTTEDGGGR